MSQRNLHRTRSYILLNLAVISMIAMDGCSSSREEETTPPPVSVQVFEVRESASQTELSYPATVEGKVNVDIRAQVTGYLDHIYVKEGEFIEKGKPLFKINDQVYRQQLNSAEASLQAAQANVAAALLEVNKLKPLVAANVVSPVQLETANAAYAASRATADQSRAMLESARINLNFTLIKAPVSGFISRIPKRVGNLISQTDSQALTTLSDISTVFAYFSMNEADYLRFIVNHKQNTGSSMEHMKVKLILADGSVADQGGSIVLASGEVSSSTAAITLKAIFPNPGNKLRTGSTAEVVLIQEEPSALLVPLSATKDMQDKQFVYLLGDSNKLVLKPISIAGRNKNNYLLNGGLKAGDKVVLTGLDLLTEGMTVSPRLTTPVNLNAKND